MKKIKLSKKERRRLIILMAINFFALFVNYFGLSPKFKIPFQPNENMVYVFTDSGEARRLGDYFFTALDDKMYRRYNPTKFWPFTGFYDEEYPNTRFRGIFADFDHSEFLVYSFLIFGIIFIRKLW